MEDDVTKCWVISPDGTHEDIALLDHTPLIIGRGPATKVKDPKCSREHVELVADYEKRLVTIKQLGANACQISDKQLEKNDSSVLKNEDLFYLLPDKHPQLVRFTGVKSEDVKECVKEPLESNGNHASSASSKEGKDNKRKLDSYFTKGNQTSPAKKARHEVSSEEEDKKVVDSESKPSALSEIMSGASRSHSSASGGTWQENEKLLVYTPSGVQNSTKIAAFDIDGTIICTKSGKVFPVNPHDWRIQFAEIPGKLKQLLSDGFKVIFITNQKGISKGKTGVKDFKGKVEAIIKRLSLPVQVFVSTGLGEFRKPLPGMWNHLEQQHNGGIAVDRKLCLYVGDAAGREANWSHGKKKDFSRSDRLFALNVGLEFFTPEEYFLNQRKAPFKMPAFDPRSLKLDTPLYEPAQSSLISSKCELILTVGCPASGKSYFTKQNLVPHGYVQVNRDLLGSWQKCVATCEKSLQAGRKVVVDNTNPDRDTRNRYISIAKKLKVSCRCFVFNISLDHAKHNNKFRDLTSTDHVHVNDIILNSFKNKYQEPKIEEGFEEILKINFVPRFTSEELKSMYTMFLLEK